MLTALWLFLLFVTGRCDYPIRTSIKSIQPDNWPNVSDFTNNQVGGIVANILWSNWEPNFQPPPCSANQVEYDGHCFVIQGDDDQRVASYSKNGMLVTGILYGVPAWARTQLGSKCNQPPGYDIFCAPDNPQDYGRFTGMIAQRYNGQNNLGRVVDFVIMNEVNANVWFNVGCGSGVPCNTDQWISVYSSCWNWAYDYIMQEQPDVRVLTSFEHHFDYVFDQPAAADPLLSVKTFINGMMGQVGSRNLRIAYHPYAIDLTSPVFSTDDLPYCTYGNPGALPGWLLQQYPNYPYLWGEIQFTESGINSASPNSDDQQQATAVCNGMRNILGTPGVTNYVYHHMVDNPNEGGLLLGLTDVNMNIKPAWKTWSTCSNPATLDCGFEVLPYTRLLRGYDPARGHWVTSRSLPPGFTPETSGWRLFLTSQPNTRALYECAVGEKGHNLISTYMNCENQIPMGPVGWIYSTEQPNTVALYRCTINSGQDHFVSTDPGCEGQTTEFLLGYAIPAA